MFLLHTVLIDTIAFGINSSGAAGLCCCCHCLKVRLLGHGSRAAECDRRLFARDARQRILRVSCSERKQGRVVAATVAQQCIERTSRVTDTKLHSAQEERSPGAGRGSHWNPLKLNNSLISMTNIAGSGILRRPRTWS
jgi:hypothetical protein